VSGVQSRKERSHAAPRLAARHARAGAAILYALVGNVDRVLPGLMQLLMAVQTAGAQDAGQVIQVGDVIEQNRVRLHDRFPD